MPSFLRSLQSEMELFVRVPFPFLQAAIISLVCRHIPLLQMLPLQERPTGLPSTSTCDPLPLNRHNDRQHHKSLDFVSDSMTLNDSFYASHASHASHTHKDVYKSKQCRCHPLVFKKMQRSIPTDNDKCVTTDCSFPSQDQTSRK